MKKILSMFLVLSFCGCTSIQIPNYIQDKNPYKRTFYAPFQKVHESTVKSLEEFGWAVDKESNPALYERGREAPDGEREQTLIFTEIRKFSYFFGTRYTRFNVYLNFTADKATDVEIRYLKVTSIPFKVFSNYKSDRQVDRIFKAIEKRVISP